MIRIAILQYVRWCKSLSIGAKLFARARTSFVSHKRFGNTVIGLKLKRTNSLCDPTNTDGKLELKFVFCFNSWEWITKIGYFLFSFNLCNIQTKFVLEDITNSGYGGWKFVSTDILKRIVLIKIFEIFVRHQFFGYVKEHTRTNTT